MTFFDYAVLLIVGVSVVLAAIRGLVREVLALIAWLAAFVVAGLFAAEVAPLASGLTSNPQLGMLAAFLSLFLVTLMVMSLLGFALSKLVRAAGLGFVDRSLGALFGLIRGLLIVVAAVLAAGLTPAPRHAEWRNAMFSAPLQTMALGLRPWLPQGLAKRIQYD